MEDSFFFPFWKFKNRIEDEERETEKISCENEGML